MDGTHLAHWRMSALRLSGRPFDRPEQVVRWLGAVQSQDYGPAKWSLGQRATAVTDADVDRAFDAGAILRTHVLRPTWHFVAPEDIRWLLTATAPRVHALNSHYYRTLGLDPAVLARSGELIHRALSGGVQLTRAQLQVVLARAGIEATGGRLAYLLLHAELEALICSGARRGRQHTYALVTERAPQAVRLDREDALAELARRYFTGHGPATVKDLRWWSSLTLAEISTAMAVAASDLRHEDIDGVRYWFAEPAPARLPATPTVHLLQGYDEYVSYGESRFVLDVSGAARMAPRERSTYNHLVVLDSQVVGHWKRTVKRDGVLFEVDLYRPLARAEAAALQAAADRHAAFLGGLVATVLTTRL